MRYTRATDYQNAILRSLGLVGRPITKLVMTMERGKLPVVEVTYVDTGELPVLDLPLACAYELVENTLDGKRLTKITLPGAENVQT